MPSFVLLDQNTTLAPNKGPYLALYLVEHYCALLNITEHYCALLNIIEHYLKHFLQYLNNIVSSSLQFLQVS